MIKLSQPDNCLWFHQKFDNICPIAPDKDLWDHLSDFSSGNLKAFVSVSWSGCRAAATWHFPVRAASCFHGGNLSTSVPWEIHLRKQEIKKNNQRMYCLCGVHLVNIWPQIVWGDWIWHQNLLTYLTQRSIHLEYLLISDKSLNIGITFILDAFFR